MGHLCGFHQVLGAGPEGPLSCYEVLGASLSLDEENVVVFGAGAKKGLTRKQHVDVRKQARQAGVKALQAAVKAVKAGKTFNKSMRMAVHGTMILGAVQKGGGKPLTAKQQKAVDKLQKAVDKHEKAARAAVEKGNKAATAAQKVAKGLGLHLKTIQVKAKMKPRVRSQGQVLGLPPEGGLDSGGEEALDPNLLDPNAFAETDPGAATPTGLSSALGREKERQSFDVVPPDGVIYDGSQGYPSGQAGAKGGEGDGMGSWNVFYGKGDGYYYRGRWRYQEGSDYGDGVPGDGNQFGEKYGWGPLIGNPNAAEDFAWVKGLKWAKKDRKWFWLRDDAPAWATAEEDRAAALAKQAADEAAAAAKEAEAAEKAKKQAELEERKAAQEAEQALTESAAESEAKVTRTKQAPQDEARQAEVETERQRAEIETKKAEAEAARAQAQAEAEAARAQAQVDAEAARAQAEAVKYQAQAELARAQRPAPSYQPSYEEGGGADGGGGEGYAEAEAPPESGDPGSTIAEVEDPWAVLGSLLGGDPGPTVAEVDDPWETIAGWLR